jgi:hypothetical protein
MNTKLRILFYVVIPAAAILFAVLAFADCPPLANPMEVTRWVDMVKCAKDRCDIVLDDSTPAVLYGETWAGDMVRCHVHEDETVHCWRVTF